MPSERSYGVIPLKRIRNSWKVLLVRHGKGHWSFPKGHAEKGEDAFTAAARELKEETGLEIRELLPFDHIEERYIFTHKGEKIFKTVTYFIALVKGRITLQEAEVTDYKWLTLKEAEEFITFPEGKRLCQTIASLLK